MGITLNDNIKLNAPKPVEAKYFEQLTGLSPRATTSDVIAGIVLTERYQGLTVNVMGTEYWFKDGVQDTDLVIKTMGGATDEKVKLDASDPTAGYLDAKLQEGIQQIQYDTSPSTTLTDVGETQWNDQDETLDIKLNSEVTLQTGQETLLKVFNDTGVTIANGSAVYISGAQGQRPTVTLARGDAEATSHCIGIATQNILGTGGNKTGFVTVRGLVRDVDTTGDFTGSGGADEDWQEGDRLWVSTTVAGRLTNVEPSVPHHSDIVGYVIYKNANNGKILVQVSMHKTLQELSDVDGTPLTTNGQLPVWDNDNGYFDFNYNINNYSPKLIEIAYADLVTAIGGSALVEGSYYRITDYATKHLIPNTSDINTGTTEPLIVFATSTNTITGQAYSSAYPNDIIIYDYTNNLCEDASTPRNGFITYRKDTINNVSTFYDWREVKYRRWEDAPGGSYISVSDTGYAYNDFYTFNGSVFSTNIGYSSQETYYTLTNNVFLNGVLDFEMGDYCFDNTFNCDVQLSKIGSFSHSNTISGGGFSNNTIGTNFQGNIINQQVTYNEIGDGFYGNQIGTTPGADFKYNKIYSDCNGNNFGNGFIGNIVQPGCYNNIFGTNQTEYNIFGSNFTYNNLADSIISQNTFGSSFTHNTFANNTLSQNIFGSNCGGNNAINFVTIQQNVIDNELTGNGFYHDFSGNTVKSGCNSNVFYGIVLYNDIGFNFYGNTLGDFRNNKISNNFYVNQIGDYFYGNTVGDDFRYNNIGTNFGYDNANQLIFGNTIGDGFKYNYIGNDFLDNKIGSNSYNNKIATTITITYSDLTGGTFSVGDTLTVVSKSITTKVVTDNGTDTMTTGALNNDVVNNHVFELGDSLDNGSGVTATITGIQFVFGNSAGQNNIIGSNFLGNTIGNGFSYNKFEVGCYFNTFGGGCGSNIFGDGCNSNIFGNNCQSNTFGNNCQSNTFGYGCYSNTFGDGCYYNIFGDGCYYNTFGDYCNYNIFGDGCYYNIFGNGCNSNIFGNGCSVNTFGYNCSNNNFAVALVFDNNFTATVQNMDFTGIPYVLGVSFVKGIYDFQYTSMAASTLFQDGSKQKEVFYSSATVWTDTTFTTGNKVIDTTDYNIYIALNDILSPTGTNPAADPTNWSLVGTAIRLKYYDANDNIVIQNVND